MSSLQTGQPAKWCPNCGKLLEPGDVICTRCGRDLRTGRTVRHRPPRSGPVRPVRVRLALVLGAAGALLAATAWAVTGALVEAHVGYLAVLIGLFSGVLIARTTNARTLGIKAAAAGLVIGGIICAKVIAVFLGAPGLARELAASDEHMAAALLDDMTAQGLIGPDTALIIRESHDGFPMNDTGERARLAYLDIVGRLSKMDAAERRRIALPYARKQLSAMSWSRRVEREIAPLDALWFLVAVGAAWASLVMWPPPGERAGPA